MMRLDALPRSMLSDGAARASLARPRLGPPSDSLIGLMIVSLFPALFWVALISGVAALARVAVPATLLLAIGAAIAAFLGVVGSALLSDRS